MRHNGGIRPGGGEIIRPSAVNETSDEGAVSGRSAAGAPPEFSDRCTGGE